MAARSRAQAQSVQTGKSREIVGICLLGLGIFCALSLVSMHAGSGTMMGPGGKAMARGLYALAGEVGVETFAQPTAGDTTRPRLVVHYNAGLTMEFRDGALPDATYAGTTDTTISVNGHTDDVGKPKENLILAQQRALAVVRDQGYAVAVDELEVGLSGVAVPVYRGRGELIASLGVVAEYLGVAVNMAKFGHPFLFPLVALLALTLAAIGFGALRGQRARGAVTSPGVYRLPEDARLNALLTAAGGVSATAAMLARSGHDRLVPQNRIVPITSQAAINGAARASSSSKRISGKVNRSALLVTMPQ